MNINKIVFKSVLSEDKHYVKRLNEIINGKFYYRKKIYVSHLTEVRLPLGFKTKTAKLTLKGKQHFIFISNKCIKRKLAKKTFNKNNQTVIFIKSWYPSAQLVFNSLNN